MKKTTQFRSAFLWVSLVLLVSLALAACQPQSGQPDEADPPGTPVQVDQPAIQEEAQQEADSTAEGETYEITLPGISTGSDQDAESEEVDPYPETGEDQITATDEPEVEAESEPQEDPTPVEEPETEPEPTSRGDALVATDPGTVSLASGEPQLVEFFAYW